jgi:serine/threonine protein phosphatase 1
MRWIIGDIHGMYLPLVTLLDEIDHRDSSAEIIFCGDYVNRGPESKRVVDTLLTLKNARFCRGNHDDTFDLLLSGLCCVPHSQLSGVVSTFEHFMKYGLEQTLLSYRIEWGAIDHVRRHPSAEAIAVLCDAIPAAHRQFFRTLQPAHVEQDFFVAHAKWDCHKRMTSRNLAGQLEQEPRLMHDVIWGRYTAEEIGRTKQWGRRGFFGHTPVTMYRKLEPITPIEGEQMVLLDTAAAVHSEGRLTAWCVEEHRYVQAERDGDLSL